MNRAFPSLAMVILLGLGQGVFAQSREAADSLYAQGKWQQAADAYEAALEIAPDDGAAWFGVAQSRHQLKRYEAAQAGYLQAQAKGFQPRGRAPYHLARAYMADGKREEALRQIESFPEFGYISHQILLTTSEFEPLHDEPRFAEVVKLATPCNTKQYRQFDFWLGQWEVTVAPASAPSAKSSITAVQGGCAVIEQFENQAGFSGVSINFFDSVTELWHQSWMGNGGGAVHLQGGLEDGSMVLSDADLAVSKISGTINRVTWTALDDGRVRQHWQVSTDKGTTWSTPFDGYYAPSKSPD